MQTATEKTIRQNFWRSSGIVVMAFIANAGLNIVLLGWLARVGGFDVVGAWALANTILLYVLMLDYGFTNALTRHAAMNGVAQTTPLIVTLSGCLVLVFLIIAGLVAANMYFQIVPRYPVLVGFLAASGGALQLLSSWLISLRLGQHEQFWFHLKSIVRIVVQTVAAVLIYRAFPHSPALAFSAALFLGGSVELLFVIGLSAPYRAHFSGMRYARASFKEIEILSRGFGMANLLQRAKEPVWRSVIVLIVGPSALGLFAVARRIPVVLSASISEAMRVLLPGLARLKQDQDDKAVLAILADSVLIQLLIVGPMVLAFCVVTEPFLILWLGEAPTDLILMVRIFSVGILFRSYVVPYAWALQAFGDAKQIALANGATTLSVAIFGAIVMIRTELSIIGFAFVFLAFTLCESAFIVYRCQTRWTIVWPSLRRLSVLMTSAAMAAFVTAIWSISAWALVLPPMWALIAVGGLIAAPYALIITLMHRKKAFYAPSLATGRP